MKDDSYRCGLPSEGGHLVEAFPRLPSHFPQVLRGLLDRYADQNVDGALYQAAAAVAIEDAWAYADGVKMAANSEVGTRALYYALESLSCWHPRERRYLRADLRDRFTDLSASIRKYCHLSPADPLSFPDPPPECLLVEVGGSALCASFPGTPTCAPSERPPSIPTSSATSTWRLSPPVRIVMHLECRPCSTTWAATYVCEGVEVLTAA